MGSAPPRAAASGRLVRKYGGSSLASPAQLAAVAGEVALSQAAGVPQVVVVSAMGGTTDQWLARARQVCTSPPGRELDMLVSVGERVTSALMAMAIHQAGGRAVSLTGSQAGIVTSDHHLAAEIVEIRAHRIEAALARGQVAVVAGYQGVSTGHEVTTLGRGGSDTTAVALAHALGAASCVLFSDVAGIYSADPAHCRGARLLGRISWPFLARMSRAGAGVVAPEASALAARTQTPLRACRSGARMDSGTLVGAAQDAPAGAFAVVAAPQVVRVARRSARAASPLPAADPYRLLGARLLARSEAAMWLTLSGVPGQAAEPVLARAADLGFEARRDAWVSWIYDDAGGGAAPPAAALVLARQLIGATEVHREPGLCAWSVPSSAAVQVAAELHASLAPEGVASSPMARPSRSATSQASSR